VVLEQRLELLLVQLIDGTLRQLLEGVIRRREDREGPLALERVLDPGFLSMACASWLNWSSCLRVSTTSAACAAIAPKASGSARAVALRVLVMCSMVSSFDEVRFPESCPRASFGSAAVSRPCVAKKAPDQP
jgi:hypothetical protein